MFNVSTSEMAIIAVVALLVLGPGRLPELARGIGKFMREFRKQTDEVRGVVEREFYQMDRKLEEEHPLTVQRAPESIHSGEVPEPPPAAPEDAPAPAPAPDNDKPAA